MTSASYYLYLIGVVVEIFGYMAPVSLASFGLYAWAMAHSLIKPGASRARLITLGLLPVLVPTLMLLVGVAFILPGNTGWGEGVREPLPWVAGQNEDLALHLLDGLWFLLLVFVAALAWPGRSGWATAIGAGLWWGWVALCAYFAACESVRETWL